MARRERTRWEGVFYDTVTKTYIARWDIGNDPVTGKRRERARGGFTNPTAAKKHRDGELAEIARGIRRDDGRERVGQFIERWLDGRLLPNEKLAPGTIENRQSVYNARIKGTAFAKLRLGDVDPSDVAALYAALPEDTKSVRHRVHRMLYRAFAIALDLELIARNPCAKESLRQPYVSPVPIFWTAPEVAAFLAKVKDAEPVGWSRRRPTTFTGMYYACRVALGTGLRAEELLTLTWPQIALDGFEGEMQITGKGRRTRTIDLDTWTVEALRDWRQSQPVRALSGLVWTYGDGRRVSYEAFASFLDGAIAAAGVRELKGAHGLRHTHAVLMLTDHDILYVSRRLGHSSVSVTDKHYAQVLPQKPSERRVLQRRPFGEILAALSGIAV